ncbi:MAG: hypothetical protein G01um101431_900 [Parcubacteria group bacterium Gr01-1014_31]|nr:MAG: hypothetical protein G01um101431_900 [Parcubacteria group bacterium Gr01-1014_31]
MEVLVKAFILLPILGVCLVGNYWLGKWRFHGFRGVRGASDRDYRRSVSSIVPLIAAVVSAFIFFGDHTDSYRMVPVWFLGIWGTLLVVVNGWYAIALWRESLCEPANLLLLGFYHLGGFWGNWRSGKDNESRPGTQHNGWAWAALSFWLLLSLSFWTHGSPLQFEGADAWDLAANAKATVVNTVRGSGIPEAVASAKDYGQKVVADGNERYAGTPLGKALGWLATPAAPVPVVPATTPAPLLPLFPRSYSWLIVWVAGTLWASFANIYCRRDEAERFVRWIGTFFAAIIGRKKALPVTQAAGTTVVGAPAATTAAAPPADERHGSKAEGGKDQRHAPPTFLQRTAEEAAAEVVVRQGGRWVEQLVEGASRLLRGRRKHT